MSMDITPKMEIKLEGGAEYCECPKCGYSHAKLRNLSKRPFTLLGGGAGAIIGGAEGGNTGAGIGAGAGAVVGGPVGAAAGAVVGALVVGAIGIVAGNVVGSIADRNVSGIYYCVKCKHKFLP